MLDTTKLVAGAVRILGYDVQGFLAEHLPVDKIKQLFFQSTKQRAYRRQISKSGIFDRRHYRALISRLSIVYRWFPIRHYVSFGEQWGLSPNPAFSPLAYLRLNPEIPQDVAPLQHFLESGHTATYRLKDSADGASYPKLSSPPQHHGVAIVLHLYFLDLWPEFAKLLGSINFSFDLFVTLNEAPDNDTELAESIRSSFPTSQVHIVPNHGRDIYPFLWLVNSGGLDQYELVGKFHGKKSAHRDDGGRWRQTLTADLLPAHDAAGLLDAFRESRAAVLTADGQTRADANSWGNNRDRVRAIYPDGSGELAEFPTGSMYWLKPDMIAGLRSLALGCSDFEPELGQLDGTTAHAVERVVGLLAAKLDQGVTTPSRLAKIAD